MTATVLEPQKKKTRLMTEGSIWKSILLFSVPLILGNLLQQLYNTADSIIVGNFVGSNALAAVGSSGSPIFLLIGFSQGIAVGAGVVVAQYLGAKDREDAQRAVHTALALAVLLGLILTIGGILVSRALLTAMDTPAEVLEDAVTYMQIYFGGVLFSVVYNMAAGILNAAGNSQRSLLYLGIASGTNILLDLVLIAGLRMGVAGAAIATDISQLVSCVLALRFLMRVQDDYRVTAREIRVHGKMAVRIIKVGLPTRDQYIENYIQTMRNLKEFGVKVICYNFMPVFDWTRTDLFHPLPDGSTALFYEKDLIQDDPRAMADYILKNLNGMTFPGWEPERMARLDELFEMYRPVTKEKLWENLKYFLEKLMPVCHECDIKMAIHMDDPPWDIFGLPRLLVDAEAIDRFLSMVDDPYNCLTLCSGSLGANPKNNVAEIVRKHCDRIAFAHIRNVKHFPNGDFSEASHRDCDGDTGILDIVKAYHDCGFEGYIRPDHGRQLWGEGPGTCRPGYGLYDRALGIMYMWGIWDMLDKLDAEKKGR